MVFKKRNIKKRHRRRVGRRRMRKTRIFPTLAPEQTFVKLRYTDLYGKTLTTGGPYLGVATHSADFINFTLNGAYDANKTIGSGPTPGFAAWTTIYEHYRVLGVRVTITFANNYGSPIIAGFSPYSIPGGATYAPITFATAMPFESYPYARQCELGHYQGSNTKKMSVYIPLHRIAGEKKSYFTDNDFIGTASTNPTIPIYLLLYACMWNNTNFGTDNELGYLLHLDFYCKFFDRAQLT